MKKYLLLFLPLLISCSIGEVASSSSSRTSTSSNVSIVSPSDTSSSIVISSSSESTNNSITNTTSNENDLYTINGSVYYTNNNVEKPFEDVTFELRKNGSTYLESTSDENGKFIFEDVEEGSYRLIISIILDGYKDYSGSDIEVNGDNKSLTLPKIVLEKKSGHWSELS